MVRGRLFDGKTQKEIAGARTKLARLLPTLPPDARNAFVDADMKNGLFVHGAPDRGWLVATDKHGGWKLFVHAQRGLGLVTGPDLVEIIEPPPDIPYHHLPLAFPARRH
jgi:hypothetical protein